MINLQTLANRIKELRPEAEINFVATWSFRFQLKGHSVCPAALCHKKVPSAIRPEPTQMLCNHGALGSVVLEMNDPQLAEKIIAFVGKTSI